MTVSPRIQSQSWAVGLGGDSVGRKAGERAGEEVGGREAPQGFDIGDLEAGSRRFLQQRMDLNRRHQGRGASRS